MTPQTFRTTVQQTGNRFFIRVPFDPNEVWGQKERHYIRGTVNGHMIRGPLTPEGTQFIIPLNPSWRRETDIETGTEVEVTLAPEGAQIATLAPDIVTALKDAPEALTFFESLATFYRNGYIQWIEAAKRPETRATRIARMVSLLKAGKKQKS